MKAESGKKAPVQTPKKAPVAPAKKQNADVSYLDAKTGEGYEGIKTSLPRIKILHFTSPVVLDGDEHVDGAKAGMFFNTVTKKIYGRTLEFIPVKALSVWLEWAPRDQGGGFRGRHAVGSLPITGDLYKEAFTKEGNEIKEALEIYGLIPDELDQGLVLLSLSGASIKHGVNWGTKIGTAHLPSGKIQPFYGSVWELELNLNKNAKGQYYTLGIANKTTIEWSRFISRSEWENHVEGAVEFSKNITSMLNSGTVREGQAALPAPDADTEY
jgi:hypothetical protein